MTMKMKGKGKKRGRPSLLDLQKRAELQQQQNQTPEFNIPQNPKNLRNQNQPTQLSSSFSAHRSTRLPVTSPEPERQHSFHSDDGDDDERKEKKVKIINNLPPTHPRSSANTSCRNSDSLLIGVRNDATFSNKPNTINEVQKLSTATEDGRNGVAFHQVLMIFEHLKCEFLLCIRKSSINSNLLLSLLWILLLWTGTAAALVSGPTTPLPDKRLLFSILDKLQKKDTRGVFAEPVDPEELPDYHEVITNPMDFSTVRKKLDEGLYVNLEQLEADISLICSNAMEYNPPHTIYFRQARSIQELAKKDLDSLRQGGESCEPPRRKRGRPPKKPVESLPIEHAVAKSSPDTTPVTGTDDAMRSNSYNLRKGTSLYKFRPRYDDSYLELPGLGASSKAATSMKYGKKDIIVDENRRNTYNQYNQLSSENNGPIFSDFGGRRKQLIEVGLQSDHSYARSLARFAAGLGPKVWEIASKRLRSVLAPGTEFGPGWIGETNASSSLEVSLVPEKLVVSSETTSSNYSRSYHQSPLGIGTSVPPISMTMSNQDLMELRQPYSQSGLALMSGTVDGTGQNSMIHAGANGFNAYCNGFGFPSQNAPVGPLISEASSPTEASVPFQMAGMVTGGNMMPYPFEVNPLCAPRNVDFNSSMGNFQMNSQSGVNAAAGLNVQGTPSWQWQGSSAQNRWTMSSPAPADLNSVFLPYGNGTQSSSSIRIGSQPLDLILQL